MLQIIAVCTKSVLESSLCTLMAHAASFDQVTDFLREVLGMISGALQGLRHEKDL